MTETHFVLFVATSLLIIVTPGQDLVLVLSRGVSLGAKAGLATAAGVSVGLLGHTFLATFGLGSLLLASELIFTTIKLIGAAYLIYLGYKLFTSKSTLARSHGLNTASLKGCFSSGALSNISNPKVTIFYFAYLPQFVSTDQATPKYLLLLGASFALLTFLVKGPIGFFSGKLSNWILNNQKILDYFHRISGTTLIILGLKLAFERK